MAGNWHRIGNISGRDGVGVPQGGAQSEVLVKEGGTDFATAWRQISYEEIAGKVPASALPQISNETYVVASQAAMLNLPAVPGRMAIRTDEGKTFVLSQLPASTLENWVELTTTSDVQSVNGKTGNVTVTKADVGLGKVNNTADADKPQATASTPGLMPASDKKDLNEATDKSTPGTLVERDNVGAVEFSSVRVNSAPTRGSELTSKDFVDSIVSDALKIVELSGAIPPHTDLDEHTTVGRYSLSSDSAGGTPENWEELNYPFRFGWGNIINQSWSSTGSSLSQIVIAHGGSGRPPQVAVRTYASGIGHFSPWVVLASDDLATSTVKGLMSPSHKALLDTASNGATANSLVVRNSSGRFNAAAPTSDGQVANKGYVDEEITRISGGDHTYADDFTNVPERTRTVIVEGAPYGSPHPLNHDKTGGIGNYNGVAKEQVWKVEEEVLGLGYATQRWTLVSVQEDHRYMLGFSWERTWIPGTQNWTGYTCVAGDTGDIISQAYKSGASNYEPGKPWRTRQGPSSTGDDSLLYNSDTSAWPVLRREGAMVHLHGAFTAPTENLRDRLASNDGFFFMAFLHTTGARFWMGSEAMSYASQTVQQGSSKNRWVARIVDTRVASLRYEIRACRYGPGDPSTRVWLPVNMMWRAPVPVALNHANASDPDALPDPGDTGGDIDTPDPEN